MSITPSRVGIGQLVTIVISTIEPTADPTIQVTLTHDGVPTPLVPDQFGRIVYTPGALGQYVIEVVVTDGSGNVGRAADAFSVPDPESMSGLVFRQSRYSCRSPP